MARNGLDSPSSTIELARNAGGDMNQQERRNNQKVLSAELKRQLNPDQRMTLNELERYGWELKFIRRRPFQEPVPVVFDGDRRKFAVLRADGTLDENPGFEIRH
jgi:hypothetical protein